MISYPPALRNVKFLDTFARLPFYSRKLKAVRPLSDNHDLHEDVILAIDVGTGGCKAAIVSRSGSVLHTGFSPHPPAVTWNWLDSMAVEQSEPSDWWTAALAAAQVCVNSIQVEEGKIAAVAVTGQMQDVIFLPKDGGDPPAAILYSDARAVLEAKEIDLLAGGSSELLQITGMPQGPTSFLAKLRWIDKHSPDSFQSCSHVLIGGHDYVTGKLCGNYVTDSTTASTTGLTNQDFPDEYSAELMHRVGLSHWLPKLAPIFPTSSPCGFITRNVAEVLGDPRLHGVPVFHSCGDAGACTVGCGAGVEGYQYIYLGTSGWIAGSFSRKDLLTPKPAGDPVSGVFKLAHPDPELVFNTGSIMTAGGNLSWAQSILRNTGNDVDSLEEINVLASSSPPGSRGLLYLPFLQGERCPFDDGLVRASLIGFSAQTERGDIYRAVMEGVAFALLSAHQAMVPESENVISPNGDGRLRLVGGGARSPLWPQIIADVFNVPVDVLSDSQEVGVKGAALLVAHSLGWNSSLSASDGHWSRVRDVVLPDKRNAEIYGKLFPIYLRCSNLLRSEFKALSPFRDLNS